MGLCTDSIQEQFQLQGYFYRRTRFAPGMIKNRLLNELKKRFDDDYVAKHFTPTYNPWDQRLCLIPDADLYRAIKRGDVEVRTEHIDTFVDDGLRLESGEVLPADVIVTATGLKLIVLSGVDFVVDGEAVDVRGLHLQRHDVFGYSQHGADVRLY